MKQMTCKQLGGACDQIFEANTFEEMAALSRQHGMQMFQEGDAAHIEAMGEMQKLMKTPGAMEKWFNDRESEFNAL